MKVQIGYVIDDLYRLSFFTKKKKMDSRYKLSL